MAHMGQTTQTTVIRYATHAHVACHHCDAVLSGQTLDFNLPERLGRYAKDCPFCYERTYYNVVERVDPLPAPKPLPTLAAMHQTTMPAPLFPSERQYNRLRYWLAAVLVIVSAAMWVAR